MSVKNEKSVIEEIFKQTLAEAKAKKFDKKKRDGASDDDHVEYGEDSGWDDKDKSIDGQEDGKEEEDTEDKKVAKMDDEDDMKKSKNKKKNVKEETLAASSLHPGARSIPDLKALTSSKTSMMQGMLGVMGTMGKQDMVNFFNQVIELYGKNKNHGIGDESGKNQSSLDMKASNAVTSSSPKTRYDMPVLDDKNNPLKSGKGTFFPVNDKRPVSAVKEDIEEMFAGQELSEEFKENISTIFEAAINVKLIEETARLEEAYEEALNEELASFKEDVTSKLDSYIDYVVENWMKENEVAIESALRNELMEEFMEGLKNLFKEHYISVPQDKIDILEELADKVKILETKLDEVIVENTELKNNLVENTAEDIFEELASDLALTQQEKFKQLAEGISFDGNLETFAKKLKIIKENYFKTEIKNYDSNINEETFEGELNESTTNRSIDPQINRYVTAIAKTTKK